MPAKAERPSADGPAARRPGSGRLDTLVVSVSLRSRPDAAAVEAFVLEIVPPPHDRWDESPYVSGLERILEVSARRPPAHTLRVTRESTNWGAVSSRADISLSVESQPAFRAAMTAEVEKAFGAMLDMADQDARRAASRDEAIERARSVVATHCAVDPGTLTLTDEEHHAAIGLWSVGLVDAHRTRYQVDVGFAGGYPASAHLRRTHEAEVVDSVDTGDGG